MQNMKLYKISHHLSLGVSLFYETKWNRMLCDITLQNGTISQHYIRWVMVRWKLFLFGAILSVTVWNACVYQIDIRHLAGYIVWYVDYFLTDLLSHVCMHVSTNFQCSWLALSVVMITNCCVHSCLVYHELYAYILYSEGQQLWLSIT